MKSSEDKQKISMEVFVSLPYLFIGSHSISMWSSMLRDSLALQLLLFSFLKILDPQCVTNRLSSY